MTMLDKLQTNRQLKVLRATFSSQQRKLMLNHLLAIDEQDQEKESRPDPFASDEPTETPYLKELQQITDALEAVRRELNMRKATRPLLSERRSRSERRDYGFPTTTIEKESGTNGPRRDPAGATPYSAAMTKTCPVFESRVKVFAPIIV